MTETGSHQERPRPSWLHEPCPEWCTRVHHEDDHPEDRLHQDDGVVIPALVGRRHGQDPSLVAEPVELLVRRSQSPVDRLTWVFIGEAERVALGLTLSVDAVISICTLLS